MNPPIEHKMKSVALTLFVALLSISCSFAYNPFLSIVNVLGCKSTDLGSGVNEEFTDFIDLFSLRHNIPRPGGLIRTRVCFKGTSNLIVQLTDSKNWNSNTKVVATFGQDNTQSFVQLNNNACGVQQNHGPLFSTAFYTCGYVVVTLNVDGTLGSLYITIEGIEPLQVSCTGITNPESLRYITFGTDINVVSSATVFYDCPLTLVNYCFDNNDEVDIGVNLNQTQSSVAQG